MIRNTEYKKKVRWGWENGPLEQVNWERGERPSCGCHHKSSIHAQEDIVDLFSPSSSISFLKSNRMKSNITTTIIRGSKWRGLLKSQSVSSIWSLSNKVKIDRLKEKEQQKKWRKMKKKEEECWSVALRCLVPPPPPWLSTSPHLFINDNLR